MNAPSLIWGHSHTPSSLIWDWNAFVNNLKSDWSLRASANVPSPMTHETEVHV